MVVNWFNTKTGMYETRIQRSTSGGYVYNTYKEDARIRHLKALEKLADLLKKGAKK